jgi:hypothetical protein
MVALSWITTPPFGLVTIAPLKYLIIIIFVRNESVIKLTNKTKAQEKNY